MGSHSRCSTAVSLSSSAHANQTLLLIIVHLHPRPSRQTDHSTWFSPPHFLTPPPTRGTLLCPLFRLASDLFFLSAPLSLKLLIFTFNFHQTFVPLRHLVTSVNNYKTLLHLSSSSFFKAPSNSNCKNEEMRLKVNSSFEVQPLKVSGTKSDVVKDV